MKCRFNPRGTAGLCLAVALLAATTSTASAERVLGTWNCPPIPPAPSWSVNDPQILSCVGLKNQSFDFGDRQVGTMSPTLRFALGVIDDTFTPSIGVSGDFSQTNECPPTLSAGFGRVQGCLITVAFAPTSTGPRYGTLSTGPGGPTIALTGNGVRTLTPWEWPLRLNVRVQDGGLGKPDGVKLEKKLTVAATTNTDSTLVAKGAVSKTTKRLAAYEPTTFKARLEHLKRLRQEPRRPKVKIRFSATDQFSRTATEELEVTLNRCAAELRGQGPCRNERLGARW